MGALPHFSAWRVHVTLKMFETLIKIQLANWTSHVYFVAISSTSGNPEFPLDHRDDWLGDHPHPCNAGYSLDVVQQNYHAFLTLPQHSEFRAWNFLVPIFGKSSSSPQNWLGRNVTWGNCHDFTIQAVIKTMQYGNPDIFWCPSGSVTKEDFGRIDPLGLCTGRGRGGIPWWGAWVLAGMSMMESGHLSWNSSIENGDVTWCLT